MKIGIIGDIMLGDQQLKTGFGLFSKFRGNYDELFHQILPIMQSFDFIIGNFEGVLVRDIEKISPETSAMKVPLTAISALKKINIKVLSLANNHSMDYGPHAFNEMSKYFNDNDILTVGDKKGPFRVLKLDKLDIAILAFSTIPSAFQYEPHYFFVDYKQEKLVHELMDYIRMAKKNSDYLIVLPHWGYEFMKIPTRDQYNLAEGIIQNGADCIVGAHPHVIQTSLRVNNKPVVFSAGNFISDYWQKRIRKNLLVEVDLANKSIQLRELFIESNYTITDRNTIRPLDNLVECLESDRESMRLINKKRNRVRKEVVFHLLLHWFDLIKNYRIILWAFDRFLFIVKNRKKLKRDPYQIYK